MFSGTAIDKAFQLITNRLGKIKEKTSGKVGSYTKKVS